MREWKARVRDLDEGDLDEVDLDDRQESGSKDSGIPVPRT